MRAFVLINYTWRCSVKPDHACAALYGSFRDFTNAHCSLPYITRLSILNYGDYIDSKIVWNFLSNLAKGLRNRWCVLSNSTRSTKLLSLSSFALICMVYEKMSGEKNNNPCLTLLPKWMFTALWLKFMQTILWNRRLCCKWNWQLVSAQDLNTIYEVKKNSLCLLHLCGSRVVLLYCLFDSRNE